MSHLTLLLLGSPSIERDSNQVVVDTRKAVALLAYLAITRHRQSRDTLAALLWPEYSQANARAALRRTLSVLKKALHGEHMIIERESVGLSNDNLLVDVRSFKSLIEDCLHHGHASSDVCPHCLVSLTEAAELYRGDFLSGFALRDSPDFDDWQLYEAETLRRDLGLALEKLARCHASAANFDRAIEYSRRWLALDRLHESAHRYLMLLYTWAGRRAAALQQYRECVQALQQELRVAPLEATTQLYNDIKENKAPSPPANQVASTEYRAPSTEDKVIPTRHSPLDSWPMVGRVREWSALT